MIRLKTRRLPNRFYADVKCLNGQYLTAEKGVNQTPLLPKPQDALYSSNSTTANRRQTYLFQYVDDGTYNNIKHKYYKIVSPYWTLKDGNKKETYEYQIHWQLSLATGETNTNNNNRAILWHKEIDNNLKNPNDYNAQWRIVKNSNGSYSFVNRYWDQNPQYAGAQIDRGADTGIYRLNYHDNKYGVWVHIEGDKNEEFMLENPRPNLLSSEKPTNYPTDRVGAGAFFFAKIRLAKDSYSDGNTDSRWWENQYLTCNSLSESSTLSLQETKPITDENHLKQIFRFEALGGGLWKIQSVAGYPLGFDVYNFGTGEHNKVQLYGSGENAAQHFAFYKDAKTDGYLIYPQSSYLNKAVGESAVLNIAAEKDDNSSTEQKQLQIMWYDQSGNNNTYDRKGNSRFVFEIIDSKEAEKKYYQSSLRPSVTDVKVVGVPTATEMKIQYTITTHGGATLNKEKHKLAVWPAFDTQKTKMQFWSANDINFKLNITGGDTADPNGDRTYTVTATIKNNGTGNKFNNYAGLYNIKQKYIFDSNGKSAVTPAGYVDPIKGVYENGDGCTSQQKFAQPDKPTISDIEITNLTSTGCTATYYVTTYKGTTLAKYELAAYPIDDNGLKKGNDNQWYNNANNGNPITKELVEETFDEKGQKASVYKITVNFSNRDNGPFKGVTGKYQLKTKYVTDSNDHFYGDEAKDSNGNTLTKEDKPYSEDGVTVDVELPVSDDLGERFWATIDSVVDDKFCVSGGYLPDEIEGTYDRVFARVREKKAFQSQYYYFARMDDGTYIIRNARTHFDKDNDSQKTTDTREGDYLMVEAGKTDSSTVVMLKNRPYDRNKSEKVRWYVRLTQDGKCLLVPKQFTDYCLTVEGNDVIENQKLIRSQYVSSNDVNAKCQEFKINKKITDGNGKDKFSSILADGNDICITNNRFEYTKKGDVGADGKVGDFKIGTHTYAFYNAAVTFDEAQKLAQTRGGHIATFETAEEWEAVKKEVNEIYSSKFTDPQIEISTSQFSNKYDQKDNYRFWLGAVRSDSVWRLLSGEGFENLSKNSEIAGEEDSAKTYLASDIDGNWYAYSDEDTNRPMGFILEIEDEIVDMGKHFYAWIENEQKTQCLQADRVETTTSMATGGVTLADCSNSVAKKKQHNYWEFDRMGDKTYRISSCSLQSSILYTGGNENTKVLKTINSPVELWHIVKRQDKYYLRSVVDPNRIIDLSSSAGYSDKDTPVVIEKTDMTIDTVATNAKIKLFDYGRRINEPSYNGSKVNNPLIFVSGGGDAPFNTDGTKYDGANGIYRLPAMEKTLVNGYPKMKSDYQNASKNLSLAYLFNPNQGNNGFVKGSGTASKWDPFAGVVKSDGCMKSGYVANWDKLLPADKYNQKNHTYNGKDVYGYFTGSDYQTQVFDITRQDSLFTIGEDGSYVYDSAWNAAAYEPDSPKDISKGHFKVYDYGARNTNDYYATEQDVRKYEKTQGAHGNFFPFNTAHEQGEVNYKTGSTNSSNVAGVTENAVNKQLNGTPVEYQYNPGTYVDRWFGMTMEIDFAISENYLFKNHDIKYTFSGDDDVWVYVDDVLVLDIGAIHGAMDGSINFSDGTVVDSTGTSTLKQKFKDAGKESSAQWGTESGKGNTFEKGSVHTLKFFYLERGGNDSNCKITYNLPTGFAKVRKEVRTNDNDNQLLTTDSAEYEFKIDFFTDEDGNISVTDTSEISNITYDVIDTLNGNKLILDDVKLNADGKFKLKNGYEATFRNIPTDYTYKVTETTPTDGDTAYENVTATYGNSAEQETEYNNSALKVLYSDPYCVTFTNKYKNLVPLDINLQVKESSDGTNYTDITDKLTNASYKVVVEFLDSPNGNVTNTETLELKVNNEGEITGQIPNIPEGTNYRIYVYAPNDNEHYYEDGKSTIGTNGSFVDYNNGNGKLFVKETGTVTGKHYEEGKANKIGNNNPSANITLYTLTLRNNIKINFFYYDRSDREENNNTPTELDNFPSTMTQTVNVKDGDKFVTDDMKQDSDGLLTIEKLGAIVESVYNNYKVSNIVDTYTLYKTQGEALKALKGTINRRTGEAYKANEVEYHFDCYGNCETDSAYRLKDDEQRWVTYMANGVEVSESEILASANESTRFISQINVWLHNQPKQYVITGYCAETDSDTTGYTTKDNSKIYVASNKEKSKTIKAYHNQRLGIAVDKSDEDSATTYLNNYGVGDGYLNEEFDTAETITKDGIELQFLYWSTAEDGSVRVATDINYYYRATKPDTLYAVYGEKPLENPGISTTNTFTDYYFDKKNPEDPEDNGAYYARINVVANPYNCAYRDENIKQMAVFYIQNTSDKFKNEDYSNLNETLSGILDNATKQKQTGKVLNNAYAYNMSIYNVGADIKLTTFNRVQFSLKVKAESLTESFNHLVAVTAMKYKNPETNEETWYISDNFIQFDYTNTSESETVTSYSLTPFAMSAPQYEMGDVDLNGSVDIRDVTLLQKHLAGMVKLNEKQLSLCDTTDNGAIDITDVTQIQRWLARK